MQSLILEGGTFRPVFSCGIMDCLLDHKLYFPYVIGVSAGITDGMSYLSRQKGRNLEVFMRYRNDKRYVGIGNLMKHQSLFGLDFVYDEVPNKLLPFDWQAFYDYPGQGWVGVTNADTGEAEYINCQLRDKQCTMLRATCAIPLVFPAIELNGKRFYDGGLADPIPIRKAIADGCDKHLIILTRCKGYVKELSKQNIVAAKVLKKKYPKLVPLLETRHLAYNETVQFCEQLEREGKALILRPEWPIESFEKDLNKLQAAYDMGYQMAEAHLDEIKAILKPSNK